MIPQKISNAIEIISSFSEQRYPVNLDYICQELGIKVKKDRDLYFFTEGDSVQGKISPGGKFVPVQFKFIVCTQCKFFVVFFIIYLAFVNRLIGLICCLYH